MAESWEQVLELLRSGLEEAAGVVGGRLNRDASVVQATPPDSASLLRFDVRLGDGATLSWFISNEDATGFSDLLIGGDGDRDATLTEMHLDALSGVFSEMLEKGVDGINARLSEPVTAGGVDMNMEPRLPIVDSGGVQALLGLQISGFGMLTIVQQGDPALVELLSDRIVNEAPAADPVADVAGVEEAIKGAPAVAASPSGDDRDNVVELPGASGPQPGARPAGGGKRDLDMLLNVPLNVTVELGRTQRSVHQLLELNVGSILELGKLAGDPMDILVNGKVLARGEVVVIDEEFGVRITEIVSPEQRLRKIG